MTRNRRDRRPRTGRPAGPRRLDVVATMLSVVVAAVSLVFMWRGAVEYRARSGEGVLLGWTVVLTAAIVTLVAALAVAALAQVHSSRLVRGLASAAVLIALAGLLAVRMTLDSGPLGL